MSISALLSGKFGDCTDFLIVVGALTVSYASLKILCSLWKAVKSHLLGKYFCIDLKKTGQWAVVTGATDGIGKGYAHQLAKKGMDIVLISRTQEKLENVAKEIESQWNVSTKCVAIDFTEDGHIYDKIKQELKDMDIGVLVNNVGMSYRYPAFYDEIPDKMVQDLIRVNVSSVAEMVKIVIPGMVKKRKGVIVNVSSASSLIPTGLLSLYASTKAFVDHFSQCLQVEYANKGVTIQSVLPMYVATNMSKIRKESLTVCAPDRYASSALNTVGIERSTCGYWNHSLQRFILTFLPDCLLEYGTMKFFLSVRKRALKKLQQKKD